MCGFFFFKHKTAYEMRISDWSSDVCSSDLTTAVLSGLSACAGIVLVPKGEPVIRQIGFVPLPHNQALAVLVGGDGSVENRVMDLPPGVSPSALIEAGTWVSARLAGLTLQPAAQKHASKISQHRAAADRDAQHNTTQGLPAWSGEGSNAPG